MFKPNREMLLVTTALVCLGGPALAQTTSGAPSATQSALQEVVVTARKTSENVQLIPEQVNRSVRPSSGAKPRLF
jgi:outer membrane receptor protein involved in Fe transport